MASGVSFPTEELKAAAWEDVYGELNRIQDEIEAGNATILEFGDSSDPNRYYQTDDAKLAHVQNMRAMSVRVGAECFSRWEKEVVDKGLIEPLHIS